MSSPFHTLEILISLEFALSGAFTQQPKLRADIGCSSPVSLPEDPILLLVSMH